MRFIIDNYDALKQCGGAVNSVYQWHILSLIVNHIFQL